MTITKISDEELEISETKTTTVTKSQLLAGKKYYEDFLIDINSKLSEFDKQKGLYMRVTYINHGNRIK